MSRLAAVALAAASLGSAAPAHAAFELTAPVAAPAQTAAGAHSDVRFRVEPRGGDIRDLDLALPSGLLGDPRAVAQCPVVQFSSADCPPETQVGTTTTTATVDLLGSTQTVPGRIYNLEPRADEPARLGVRIDTPGEPARLQSTVRVRPEDHGLTAELRELPRRAGGFDVTITALDVVLSGRFATNPTSCAPAETRFVARPYDGETRAEARAGFTPTACDALPFAPRLEARIGAPGLTAQRDVSPLSTAVSQERGEANLRSVAVTLPPDVSVGLDRLGRACPADQLAAGACPPAAEIGSASAATPLLAAPLAGAVTLARGSGPLPDLVLTLRGLIGVTVRGTTALGPGGLTAAFDGLPDVPLSRFALEFRGGDAGVLELQRDLCVGRTPRVAATFTAQSGRQHTATVPAAVAGCRPRSTLRLGSLRRGRPALRLRVDAGPARATRVTLRLPGGLRLRPGARVRALGARGATAVASPSRVTLRRTPVGARTLAVRVRAGDLRVTRRALRRSRRALSFRVETVDGAGTRVRQTVRARPGAK